MNIYKKKRQKINMSDVDMARKLGLDIPKYKLIEKGIMKMPKELIDKFNTITNNGAINKIDELEHAKDVNIWFEENYLNDEKLKEILNQYNIVNLKHLGQLLGYKDASMLSKAKKIGVDTSYDLKNKIYSFLTNEMNIQLPIIETNKKQYNKKPVDSWYYTFDLKGFLSDNKMTLRDFSDKSGIAYGTIWKLYKDTNSIPQAGTISKLKDFVNSYSLGAELVDNNIINNELSKEFPEIPAINEECKIEELVPSTPTITEEKPKHNIDESIDKYKQLLTMLDNTINDLNGQINELTFKKGIYSEVLKELELIKSE